MHAKATIQEQHHYLPAEYSFDTLETYKKRDTAKRELAKAKEMTIITVPFWWDRQRDRLADLACVNYIRLTFCFSLIATIQRARPDLLIGVSSDGSEPIPTEMPPEFLESQTPRVEDIGQPVTACFFTLSRIDPKNWYPFSLSPAT